MGNNNSIYATNDGDKMMTNSDSILLQLYGKSSDDQKVKPDYYIQQANNFMKELNNNISQKNIDVFINPSGYDMPYVSRMVDIPSTQLLVPNNDYDMFTSSGNSESESDIRYIEIELCRENGPDAIQRFAVNQYSPDHTCGPNCECIMDTVQVTGGRVTRILPRTRPMIGGANKNDTSESTDSNTSPLETSDSNKKDSHKKTKDKMKKPKTDDGSADEFEDSGEIDEELDKIEDEDEDVSEDGILLNGDDVDSTELYRMQNRLFGSDTPSDNYLGNDFDDNNTEEVERAMNDIDREKQMFSSEENEILNMKSPSRVTNKKHNPNKKYGQLK
jgi:hypothetical protein